MTWLSNSIGIGNSYAKTISNHEVKIEEHYGEGNKGEENLYFVEGFLLDESMLEEIQNND